MIFPFAHFLRILCAIITHFCSYTARLLLISVGLNHKGHKGEQKEP